MEAQSCGIGEAESSIDADEWCMEAAANAKAGSDPNIAADTIMRSTRKRRMEHI